MTRRSWLAGVLGFFGWKPEPSMLETINAGLNPDWDGGVLTSDIYRTKLMDEVFVQSPLLVRLKSGVSSVSGGESD